MTKAIKKPSRMRPSLCEGSLALTSDQVLSCERYEHQRLMSRDLYRFDGAMYDVLKRVYHDEPSVLAAMADSIKDEHCTKQFCDWENTFDQFDHFLAEERKNALWTVDVRVGCALVKEALRICHLQPARVECADDLINVFSNLNASAGLANYGSTKRDSLSECFETSERIRSLILKGCPFQDIYLPAQVFHRAQISGFITDDVYHGEDLKRKDRFVWGIDGGTVGVEAPYAKPLIDHISRLWTGYVGGKSPNTLRDNIAFGKRFAHFWTSIDFSLFDQTVPSWLIEWCFSCIKEFFSQEHHKIIDWICYNFINTRVIIPGRGIFQKHRGIPSGSNFTQLIGSMVNAVVVLSFIARGASGREFHDKISYVREQTSLFGNPSERSVFVMGDDDLVFTQKSLDLQELAEYVDAVFGMKINPSKCHKGDRYSSPVFLKREWRGDGEYQDPHYLTINCIHSERDRTYDGYSPWHILYGLFLTYRYAFPSSLSERLILEEMEKFGGVKALTDIPKSDLPGVYRSYGDKALKWLRYRAERLLREYRFAA